MSFWDSPLMDFLDLLLPITVTIAFTMLAWGLYMEVKEFPGDFWIS